MITYNFFFFEFGIENSLIVKESVAKMESAVHETVNRGTETKETSARVVFVVFLVSFICFFLFVFIYFLFVLLLLLFWNHSCNFFLTVLCPKAWAPDNNVSENLVFTDLRVDYKPRISVLYSKACYMLSKLHGDCTAGL